MGRKEGRRFRRGVNEGKLGVRRKESGINWRSGVGLDHRKTKRRERKSRRNGRKKKRRILDNRRLIKKENGKTAGRKKTAKGEKRKSKGGMIPIHNLTKKKNRLCRMGEDQSNRSQLGN